MVVGMSKFLSLDSPRKKDDVKSEERKYDPQCGVSKEEFEWRCAQFDRVSQRMPQLLEKLNFQLQTMRGHFLDDPVALKKWDVHEENICYAYTRNLRQTLLSPLFIPDNFGRTNVRRPEIEQLALTLYLMATRLVREGAKAHCIPFKLHENSVLYEQLMKRRAQSKTFVGRISGGLDNLKQAAARNKRLVGAGVIGAGFAAAFALGLAVGRTPLRESKQRIDGT